MFRQPVSRPVTPPLVAPLSTPVNRPIRLLSPFAGFARALMPPPAICESHKIQAGTIVKTPKLSAALLAVSVFWSVALILSRPFTEFCLAVLPIPNALSLATTADAASAAWFGSAVNEVI